MTRKIALKGYKQDKSGKFIRSTKGKSKSKQIAERKRPSTKWRKAQ